MTHIFLEHTGDVKFQASGKTFEEMLTSASKALLESMKGDLNVEAKKEKYFGVNGKDKEELLHNFLEEFLYLLEAENFLVSKVKEIKFDSSKTMLSVNVFGDDANEYEFTNQVKAITFNEMYVKNDNGWSCQVVLDV